MIIGLWVHRSPKTYLAWERRPCCEGTPPGMELEKNRLITKRLPTFTDSPMVLQCPKKCKLDKQENIPYGI